MDSDYVPSNDSSSDINSVTSSNASVKFLDIFPDLSEDDIHEITENILEQIDSYMKTEIIQISSPNFYTNMVEIISDCVLEEWISLDLCDKTIMKSY